MKKLRKGGLWGLLLVLMAFLAVPCTVHAEETSITRVQWLHDLTELFDMTVEEDNYPDNYFSDISDKDEYYRDVMVATEFGLVDVEEGYELKPEEPVTREFAAYTMNVCMGYVAEENSSYSFSDTAAFEYQNEEHYQAAQAAVDHNWIALKNGKFCPKQNLTEEEKANMWVDAQELQEFSEIDENYDGSAVFADDVIEIPKSVELTFEEYEDGTYVTLFDYTESVNTGDKVAIWKDGIPDVYQVISAENMGSGLVLGVQKTDKENDIEKMDIQGVAEGDLANAVSLDGGTMVWIEGGTAEQSYEDGRQIKDPRFSGTKNFDAIKKSKTGELGDGLTAEISVTIPNPKVKYKATLLDESFAELDMDIISSITIKGDMMENIGLPVEVPMVDVPVLGVGKVKVSMAITAQGQCSVSSTYVTETRVSYRPGKGSALTTNFYKKKFTFSAEAELTATLTASCGITEIKNWNASVWAKIGPRAAIKAWTYDDDEKPAVCMDTYAFVEAKAGATLKIAGKDHSPSPIVIWSKQNSPIRLAAHYEDGRQVGYCTREVGSRRYYTKSTSKYFSDGSGNYFSDSTGSGSTGSSGTATKVVQPRYEYKLTKNAKNEDVATITKYYGTVAAITVPKTIDGYTVTGIGYEAFKGNTYLTSVLLPDTITEIGMLAFKDCTGIEVVSLPSELEVLPYGAFQNCTSLTEIKIPKTVTNENQNMSIGPFWGCTLLKNVVFEDGMTKVPNGILKDASAVESVVLPSTVTEIGNDAFNGCTSLKQLPDISAVTKIDYQSFKNCTSLKSIDLSDTITEIGMLSFSGCNGLEQVKLPKNLQILTYGAFQNCASLTEISIPKTVTNEKENLSIGPFSGCTSLKNVVFEEGMTKVPVGILKDASAVENVMLPNTVTEIGNDAFNGCASLKQLPNMSSVTKINYQAFKNCTSLKSIDLSDTITVIGIQSFSGCSGLEQVKLPKNLQILTYGAFQNCASLTEISIPKTVTNKNENLSIAPFEGCISLKKVVFEEETTKVSHEILKDASAVETVVIPDTVTEIEYGAFKGCTSIVNLTLPKNLTELGESSFEHCDNLAEVILPAHVKKINNKAFKDCLSLTSVTIPEATTTIGSNVFSYPARMTIYGVAGSYAETYAAEKNINFVAIEPETPDIPEEPEKEDQVISVNSSYSKTYGDSAFNLNAQIIQGDGRLTYSSDHTEIAVVDGEGNISIKGTGTANITISASETKSFKAAQTVVTVIIAKAAQNMSINCDKTVIKVGEKAAIQVSGNVGAVTFLSDNTQVLSVDTAGTVTGDKEGTASITVTSAGDQNHESASEKISFTVQNNVENKISLNDCFIKLNGNSYVYTGSAITPDVTVTYGNESLKAGQDYTVSYLNNINSGTASVFVSACEGSKYSGTFSVNFEIKESITDNTVEVKPGAFKDCDNLVNLTVKDTVTSIGDQAFADCKNLLEIYFYGNCPKMGNNIFQNVKAKVYYPYNNSTWTLDKLQNYGGEITWIPWNPSSGTSQKRDLALCHIDVKTTGYTYNGSPIVPAVTITDGAYILINGTDYVISCTNNVNAGNAVVTINGTGNYGGNSSTSYTIGKAKAVLQFQNAEVDAKYGDSAFTNLLINKVTDGKISYISDNTGVASVNSTNGNVNIVSAGTAKITVSAEAGTNYEAAEASFILNVEKAENIINAADINRNFSKKAQKVKLGVNVQDGAALSYSSNNKFVKVNGNGQITIAKKFAGKAVISISAGETSRYKAAFSQITVTVKPSGVKISKVSNSAKGKATVFWKKNANADGYLIQYSTDKKFKSGVKTMTVKKAKTVKTTLKKLKKGKTYYIRICTYKGSGNARVTSSWSKTKSVKIRK